MSLSFSFRFEIRTASWIVLNRIYETRRAIKRVCGSLCRRRGDELLVLSRIVAIVYFSQLEKNDDPWRESIVIVFAVNIRGGAYLNLRM